MPRQLVPPLSSPRPLLLRQVQLQQGLLLFSLQQGQPPKLEQTLQQLAPLWVVLALLPQLGRPQLLDPMLLLASPPRLLLAQPWP